MRRLAVASLVLVVAGVVLWVWIDRRAAHDDGEMLEKFAMREAKRHAGTQRTGAAPAPMLAAAHAQDHVVISGTVIDRRTTLPVSNVEVVLTSDAGEQSVTSSASGEYAIEVPRGNYRAFVRDDTYISVGPADRVRVPHAAAPEAVGLPDESRMPLIVAQHDVGGIELPVVGAGKISGTVTDADGEPIAHAIVEAKSSSVEDKPVLGTQLAETGDDGSFLLRVPEGEYVVSASHTKYADSGYGQPVTVSVGNTASADLELYAGCIISGRVVRADGSPGGEGALDMQDDTGASYGPAGLIQPDGTFRWTTTEEETVSLRAWPWKSPPSAYETFDCKDGARFKNVTFIIPDRDPDITGRLVDANGNGVPFAYLDLIPEDPANIGQQERTDERGNWHVYAMPPGRYRVEATVPGKGVVTGTVVSPSNDVLLTLSGTGRIEGTTTNLANGSFIAQFETCNDENVELSKETRMVSVVGGRFAIENVPACDLRMIVRWRQRRTPAMVVVERGQTAHVELDVGPVPTKHVHGIVRDEDGNAVAGALVHTSPLDPNGEDTARAPTVTDGSGRYELDIPSGTAISVSDGNRSGSVGVGYAHVKDEEVDITLEPDR